MIATALMVLWWIFQALIGTAIVTVLGWGLWVWVLSDWFAYRRARKDIIPYVQSYKTRCRGVNRFVVTVTELQGIFTEYDTPTIERVWQDLIKQHVIVLDELDNEWCVK